MRYFNISHGLRGCYMPDGAYVIAVKTRRELRDYMLSEARMLRSESTVGLTDRRIATVAADAWRREREMFDFVVPYRERGQDGYPYGLFVSNATRADYLAHVESEG